MNKKSKEIVKKLCFTLVIVISIITIIGCPNTVSNKTDSGAGSNGSNPPPPPLPTDPNDWSGLTADQVIQKMMFTDDDPIVTDYRGLGFGEKDKGNFRILSYEPKPAFTNEFDGYEFTESPEGSKRKLWSLNVLNNYISNNHLGPLVDVANFTTVQKGLEERWKAAKETKEKKDGSEWLLFYPRSTSELDGYLTSELNLPSGALKNVGFFKFAGVSQRFAVDKNKDIIVFVTDTTSSHFADWHVVFVEKVTNPKMYSFHYGPYTLKNKEENDPEVHFPNYENNKLHIFTLSEMLKDTLGKKYKVEKHLATVLKDFPPLKKENKGKYDVYLVIGRYIRDGGDYFGYGRLSRSFRNVFKLSDYAYWGDCWEKDESVKTTSP